MRRIVLTYRMKVIRPYSVELPKIKKKGIHAFMMQRHQLAFTRRRPDGKGSQGGGWLHFRNNNWYFSTWAPRVFRIEKKRDIPQICQDYLAYCGIGIGYQVPEEFVARYRLKPLSPDEQEIFFDEWKDRS